MIYQTYELLKQEWIAKHPNATNEQYQQAMKLISKKLGI